MIRIIRTHNPGDSLSFLLCLILTSSFFHVSTSRTQHYIKRGTSLAVENHNSDLITSQDSTFTCGFYSAGENAYWFAIWFTNSKDRTVVWTANRELPVNGHGSKVALQGNGAMSLIDVDDRMVWQTNTTSTDAERAELLDTGNLVVKDSRGSILWQSFDSPTDTLLPTQLFTRNRRLISVLRKGIFASGYYNLYFDSDNVLRLIYDGPEVSSIYWPSPSASNVWQNGRTSFNSTRIAFLDDTGRFSSSDWLSFNVSDMGLGIKRRLTLDHDGNLRVYSLNPSSGLWSVTWEAMPQGCNVHGLCGRYGVCVYSPRRMCVCPPGHEARNSSDMSQGCKPTFNLTFCSNPQQVKFVELPNTDYYGFDLNASSLISFEACKKICLDDCNCEAFVYRLTGEGTCYTKGMLYNGLQVPNFPGTMYLKLPATFQSQDFTNITASSANIDQCGSAGPITLIGSPSLYLAPHKGIRWVYLYSFASAIGAFEFLLIVSSWWFLFRRNEFQTSLEKGYRIMSSQFRGFSYTELKKVTDNFKVELGRGGSGAVYKGVLDDQRVVAVKRLGDVFVTKEDEFWAEMSTIGKINHMNLVRMWGFCSEGKHRLLVYEFVENSSLDKHLFSTTSSFLGWEERFKVAIGTAKGLAYLHHECLEWVIHCDVKPENILLGSEFEPKIADFGLAKLSQRDSLGSQVTRIRGTKGYMAPEWALNLPITAKVDVYGYGVVILELVKGIRLSSYVVEDGDHQEQETELTKFVRLAKEKAHEDDGEKHSWVEEMVDPRLGGQFNRNQAATLVKVGLSCVEEDRSKRPTMESVVQLLLDCLQAEDDDHNP